MNTSTKILIGLGVAGAAYLLFKKKSAAPSSKVYVLDNTTQTPSPTDSKWGSLFPPYYYGGILGYAYPPTPPPPPPPPTPPTPPPPTVVTPPVVAPIAPVVAFTGRNFVSVNKFNFEMKDSNFN